MKTKVFTGCTSRVLMTVIAIAFATVTFAQWAGADETQSFFVLDNPGDLNFNQLLGINDGRVIVGYFGDGTVIPNNGYVLVPKNHYSVENFTNLPSGDVATETQAIGANNLSFLDIVGFYTDGATGFTHGFRDSDGVQSPIDDPAGSTPNVTTPAQNLLGINDFGQAAGFWTDNNGKEHGFVVQLDTQSFSSSTFTEIPPTFFNGPVATRPAISPTSSRYAAFGRTPMATITASLGVSVEPSLVSMSTSRVRLPSARHLLPAMREVKSLVPSLIAMGLYMVLSSPTGNSCNTMRQDRRRQPHSA